MTLLSFRLMCVLIRALCVGVGVWQVAIEEDHWAAFSEKSVWEFGASVPCSSHGRVVSTASCNTPGYRFGAISMGRREDYEEDVNRDNWKASGVATITFGAQERTIGPQGGSFFTLVGRH
ncbi:hypothetical protein DFH27DRAFT_524856 [Peziza echinospora]|nr:hypothetical protein DFH27DRAFT_524856 [Peziza echinospora]